MARSLMHASSRDVLNSSAPVTSTSTDVVAAPRSLNNSGYASSWGSSSKTALPLRPARAVRPARWTKVSGFCGASTWITRSTSSTSRPRAATSVHSSATLSEVHSRNWAQTALLFFGAIFPCNAFMIGRPRSATFAALRALPKKSTAAQESKNTNDFLAVLSKSRAHRSLSSARQMTCCETNSVGVLPVSDPELTLTETEAGFLNPALAKSRTARVCVAEKRHVLLCRGKRFMMRSICKANPSSNKTSASSRMSNSTPETSRIALDSKSSSLPGVAISISHRSGASTVEPPVINSLLSECALHSVAKTREV
mmetsp:Transcript_11591/g.34140  ORF Transcript_11591/g.34140 Transcript_11591/m.34140 type:complete len:311 (-) Transcript_11591:438-1370(-)